MENLKKEHRTEVEKKEDEFKTLNRNIEKLKDQIELNQEKHKRAEDELKRKMELQQQEGQTKL